MNSDEQNHETALRSFVNNELEKMVSHVATMLAADAPAPMPSANGGLAGLAGAADARREAVRLRRELAMELVVGALLNEHNPDWDPRDPSTCRAAADSEVLQLLK
jgi:hypothetical protein